MKKYCDVIERHKGENAFVQGRMQDGGGPL